MKIARKAYHRGMDMKNWKARSSFDFSLILPWIVTVGFVVAIIVLEI